MNNKKPKKGSKFPQFLITGLLTFSIISVFFAGQGSLEQKENKISFNKFENIIIENATKENKEPIKVVETSQGKIYLTIGDEKKNPKDVKIYTSQVNPLDSGLKDVIQKYDIDYEYHFPKNVVSTILNLIFYGFLFFIIWTTLVPMMKTKGGATTNSKDQNIPKITFEDVGGISEETKQEILQRVELMKRPDDASVLGIKPAKGILLYGPAGTGKTLLAKAIANTFNAEFFATDGSSFVEIFAGMGAKRARDLFDKAKKHAPSVIFIDEIDAVGKKRSSNGAYSNEEREQTLNKILVLLDGVEELKDVFVVAATNRLDMLDEALLRPGRFDFKIKIDLPDVEGRKEIIKIHTKNKPLSQEVLDRIDEIAHSTSGYSGAELESLFDNAAYSAFKEHRKEITMDDVNVAIDRVVVGSTGRKIRNEEMKKRVAYHEAGHASVTSLLNPGSIRKATIVPRGGALGYVAPIPKEELMNRDDLINHLKVMVAGGVAETIIFGNHSMGVSDDFKRAKELAEKMVEDWGMGDKQLIPTFSDKDKSLQAKRLYEDVVSDTIQLINNNYDFFDKVALLLLEKETVDGVEIEALKESDLNEEISLNEEDESVPPVLNN